MHKNEWKMLYESYYKPLYLYALSLTGNTQDAEDLVQETFVKAFLSYEEKGSIKYWLVVVLKHLFINQQKRQKREMLDNGEEVLISMAMNDENLLERIILQEERRQLFRMIQALPLQMREMLMESVYFHMKDEEIAKMHGLSRENVRKIRSRAKQKLIEQMKEDRV